MADEHDDTTGGGPAADADYPTTPSAPPRRGSQRPWIAAVAGLAVLALVGGAVVLRDDGDDRPPVLSVVPGGQFEAADAGIAATSMSSMMAVEYVLDGELPDLGSEGTAYRLVRPDLDDAAVVRLAAALGVDGSVEADGGTRVVSDGERAVQVIESPGSGWYVSSYETYPGGDTSVSSEATTMTTMGPAAEPPDEAPPAGDVPSEAEAEAVAREVLDAAAIDGEWRATVTDGIVAATAELCAAAADCGSSPEPVVESRSVTLTLVVDDAPTDVTWSFDIGRGGEIRWASGAMVAVEAVGDYPLRPTADVYDDLVTGDSWYGGGWGGGPAVGGASAKFEAVGSAIDAPVASDDTIGIDSTVGVVEGSAGCTPEECGLEPDPVMGGPVCDPAACEPVVTCVEPPAGVESGCMPTDPVPPVPCDDTAEVPANDVPQSDVPGAPDVGAPVDAGSGTSASNGGTEPSAGTAGSCVGSVLPEPVPAPEPLPEPDPVVVHVTGAERSLLGVPGGDDVTWLLPAYRFLGTWEGGEPWSTDLPAIDESYLDLPEPAPAPDDSTTLPPTPATETTTPASPETTAVPTTAPVEDPPPPAPPTSAPVTTARPEPAGPVTSAAPSTTAAPAE